jgi:hypothetical protein
MKHDFTLWWLEKNASRLRDKDGAYILQQEKRLRKKIQKVFERQKKHILDHLKNLSFLKNSKEDAEIALLLASMPAKAEMVDDLADFWAFLLVKGGKRSVKEYQLGKYGISFDLKNEKAIKWLRNKKIFEKAPVDSPEWTKARDFLRLSDYRGNIDFTTKERIKKMLEEALETGESYSSVAKKIEQQGEAGVFSRARAELITTHEIGIAYEQGKKIPLEDFWKENPDREPEKKWIVRSACCDICADNGNQNWIAFSREFSSGHTEAPAHPHCHCSTGYQIPPPRK